MNPRGCRTLLPALVPLAAWLVAAAGAAARTAATSHAPDHTLTGRVVDHSSGEPIPAARVAIQGSAVRASTDEAGRFSLTMPGLPARVTAWAPGYYINGIAADQTQPITIRLTTHPQDDSPDYQWIDPNPDPQSPHNCANCHAGIYRQWSASSHARSAVNKHFLDMFAGTDWAGRPGVGWNFSADHPEARAVCAACHLPTVPGDHPAAADPRRARAVEREGIHCDFCHKIADTDLGPNLEFLGLQHGRDAMRFIRPAHDRQVFFGPLDDVDRGEDTFAPLYSSSLYCASCHEGTLFGTKVYETYSEWAASSFARDGVQCQHCHMKPDGVTRNIAPGRGGIDRDPATLSTHQFPGSADESFLRSSVRLALDAKPNDDSIHVVVQLESVEVGHHLPTGSPDRHLLLVVRARDRTGRALPQRGGPTIDAAGGVGPREAGNFAGTAGKLYGKLLRGPDGSAPAPFWQAAGILYDTRLKPGEPDRTEFEFDNADAKPPWAIEAKAIYRRFYKSVRDEKGWPDRDVVLADETVVLEDRRGAEPAPAAASAQ